MSEHETALYKFEIKGIDCADCAAKLESKIAKIEGISNVRLSFLNNSLQYECDHDEGKRIEAEVRELTAKEEPDAVITSKGHQHHHYGHEHHHEHEHEHHHDHCECGEHEHHHDHCDCAEHEHHHQDDDSHEEERALYKFEIKGIDCADCAAKLESKITKIEGISNVRLSFLKNSLQYECDHDEGKRIEAEVRELTAKEEPDAVITSKGHQHLHHDHCECGEHEHHHEHHADNALTRKYTIRGIDCADCAAKLESRLSSVEGAEHLSISFINSLLVFDCADENLERVEKEIIEIAAKEEPDAVIEKIAKKAVTSYQYRIAGIDCADCANELAEKALKINGVTDAQADFMREILSVQCASKDRMRIEKELIEMIAKEEPEVKVSFIEPEAAALSKPETDDDDDDSLMLKRLIAGAVLFAGSLFVQGPVQIVVSLCAWLVLGYDVLYKAVRGIGRGQVFDEHFLMAVATIAAIYLKDYREAAGVMLFYQIGEYFQDLAVRRSRRSIGELMDIRPDYAWVRSDGEYVQVNPDDVSIGDIIRVRPGEKIPLDGIVVNGSSSLDTSSLTGESKMQDVDSGDNVISGAVNKSGVLEIRVTKEYGESTVARILELVENSDSSKAKQEKFITKFSRWYTPLVVLTAVITAVIVSVVYGDVNEGIRRACTFLVISCPCALVISIPLSFFAGIGGLSGKGILVKGANVIETLAHTKQAVFDKTGTLTAGEFEVERILDSADPEGTLKDAAYAEYHSGHPIAEGIRRSYNNEIDEKLISDVQEIAGRGLAVSVNGKKILAGNYRMMQDNGIACKEAADAGTHVYVAEDGVYKGCLLLTDRMKQEAPAAVQKLHDLGTKCIILSGDQKEIAESVSKKAGADEVHGECMPEDKVRLMKEIRERGTAVFVGDGVNDAPVLAAADAGFAMGVLGSDAAIEAADVVIMDDSLKKIPLTLQAASRIIKVANENIYSAIGIKLLILILGAFGIANMWMAIFADTGVAMLCVMNSMRLLHVKEN